MGGRGGTSGVSINQKINNELDKIRDARREKLLVFDSSGNIVYKEGGNLNHTGYGVADYEGKIVAHNHPKGTYPFPSDTDFDTYQREKAKEMIIVSRDYDVRLRKDPSYKNLVRENITNSMRWTNYNADAGKARNDLRSGNITREQYIQRIFDLQKKAAKRAGYILEAKKRKKK